MLVDAISVDAVKSTFIGAAFLIVYILAYRTVVIAIIRVFTLIAVHSVVGFDIAPLVVIGLSFYIVVGFDVVFTLGGLKF